MKSVRSRGLAAIVAFVSLVVGGAVQADNLGIHVSGRGEVLVEPDMAYMTLQVTRQGRDAVALKNELDQVVRDTLALTDKLDIPRKDVTAALVSIHPHRRYDANRNAIDGVEASRTITIVLRDLARYGELMNAALTLGVNNIGNVRLDTSERIALERQALERAIDDAKDEASRIAKHFGVRLGGVTNVQVGRHSVQPVVAQMAARDSAESGGFSPGEMTIARDVQVSFAIGGQ